MDEFQGAYLVSRLEHELPYRDFRPYKNVLGYYLQAIPLKWSHSTWQGLMSIKFATLGVNIVAILSAAHLLAKRFRRTAVCFGTLMFVVMTTFLERSAVLRVGMLTA